MFDYLTLTNLWSLCTLVLDIGLLAVFIYYCLKIVKTNTRTIQIFKGIIFIFLLNGLAQILSLKTIEYFTSQFLTWGIVAIVIIFQPEIRSLLEKLGKTTVFSRISTLTVNEREYLVDELVKTCAALSTTKTGALISIEQGQSLSDYIKTGTAMNSVVSSELLCSIFQYGTPLHDGAVIIQGDKIACASAYFPPTSRDFPSSYGARHRAAVGISEISDCVTIIVSEESGNISIAREGSLIVMNENELREYLLMMICQGDKEAEKEKEETKANKKEEPATMKDVLGKTKQEKMKASQLAENKKFEKKKIDSDESYEKIEAEEIVALPKRRKSKIRPASNRNKEGGES